MTNTTTKIACIFLALLAASSSVMAENEAETDLLAQLEAIRQRNGVAAFGLVVVENDAITVLSTNGVADRISGEPIGNKAIFRIGSISKMFTGLLAAVLESRHVLRLNEPIQRWPVAGTYSNSWSTSQPITTAQLLEHSAGLTDLSKPEWDYSDPRQLPLKDTLRLYPESRVTRWPPGLHYSYSNAGAGLAGYVMELATGKSYETLIQTEIFEPLAMTSSTVLPPDPNQLPVGYDSDGITPIPYWHQIFRPFAAINTTLEDSSRFIRMLINRGELDTKVLVKPSVIARLEAATTTLGARAGLDKGYGLGNYNWYRRGVEFRGHGGDADGYLSRLGYTRSNNSGYFLVITAFQGKTLRAMEKVVETYLIRDLSTRRDPIVADRGQQDWATLLGDYRRVSYRFGPPAETQNLQLFETGETLSYRIGSGRPKVLVPTGKNSFRHESKDYSEVFIGPDELGTIYFQSGSDNFQMDTRQDSVEN
ncbi:MAG: serine hydrolase domain-containing protein [Halioglobus sp.]